MTFKFPTAMRQALRETCAGDVATATSTIQAALAAHSENTRPGTWADKTPQTLLIGSNASGAARPSGETGAAATSKFDTSGNRLRRVGTPNGTPRQSLKSVLHGLRHSRPDFTVPAARKTTILPRIADGARYEQRHFSCSEGARDYRIYVPGGLSQPAEGLLLMLHGCTQTADDFACGTGMNQLAEQHNLIILYPEQNRAENPSVCWNWFRPQDQRRGAGEPSLLAALTRQIEEEFKVKRGRAFTAGLSAGGAMAATLGAVYPDVYCAIGVHSGLAHGAAHDVPSAFAAMRGDMTFASGSPADQSWSDTGRTPRIVFHGSGDGTVHPSNADRVFGASDDASAASAESGISAGGRRYHRTIVASSKQVSARELWMIEGSGHAWSGGSATGSFTDPVGPDASAEMVRFFLQAESREFSK
uniref:extracellular catalytic domain type 1 short-chain-length polyhydroxyalkanoate depolymerase n=1 Tax=Pararhizobium sp. IMCC3301 TaxID=3067904 RepID=UPI002741B018|nr:PHB depolymerase family esterase [Pararhizobium sp. IMCC3301]